MAKLTLKSQLTANNLVVDVVGRTITLVDGQDGLVAKDGVTWQALYSAVVDLWTTSAYNEHPFPFYVIDVLSGQFAIGTDGAKYNDWTFAGSSRLYLRDGGWDEYTPNTPAADGTSDTLATQTTYAGIVSLGTVSSGSQLYYQLTNGGAAANFQYTDAANIGIDVTGSTSYFKAYCREYAKTYSESVLSDTGKTSTGAYIVNMLLSNADDLNVVNTDTDVITTPIAPYNKMSIKYFSGAFNRIVESGVPSDFGIVVDCGTHSGIDGSASPAGSVLTTTTGGIVGADYIGGTVVVHEGLDAGTYTISGTPTATTVTVTGSFTNGFSGASFTIHPAEPLAPSRKQIYTFVQAKLRQATSINDVNGGGSVVGKTASLLLNWTADLVAGFYAPINPEGGGSGVCIEGYAAADVNSIEFYDNTATSRKFPSKSTGTWTFNSPLQTGGTGYYYMYIKDGATDQDWGNTNAVIVKDAGGNDIAGTISGGSISFDFDYTGNTQAGRSGPTDVPVVLVAGNPGSAKPVVSFGTIGDSKSISFASVAETDRAYA